jgi:hypothetical protein
MTPEQRLDRLERLAKLFVKAGRRTRRQVREQNDKINMLIAAQMMNEEKLGGTENKVAALAESQAHTDRRLDALIDVMQGGRDE